ncbi:Serine arginine-rich splicing factor 2 [Orobanche gracilis]
MRGSERGRVGEWTTVSYGRRRPPEGTNILTMYVSNLPTIVKKRDIWKALSKFGEIVDVYVALKQDSHKKTLAFVRFKGVRDKFALEAEMQGVMLFGKLLQINIAKFGRKEPGGRNASHRNPNLPPPAPPAKIRVPAAGLRDGRSFAAAAGGVDPYISSPPALESTPIVLSMGKVITEWIRDDLTYWGVALSMEHLKTFNPELVVGDEEAFNSKYLGGLTILIKFRSVPDVNGFMGKWKDWFSRFGPGDPFAVLSDRVAWIKVVGLPGMLWDSDNFSNIGERFGRVLIPFETPIEARDLSFGRLCILTKHLKRINEIVPVAINDRIFKISVVEVDDLQPPFCPRSVDDSLSLPPVGEQ